MINKINGSLLASLLAFVCSMSPILSGVEDSNQENSESASVVVGERALSTHERIALESLRSDDEDASNTDTSDEAGFVMKAKSNSSLAQSCGVSVNASLITHKATANQVVTTTHPGAFHFIYQQTWYPDTTTLEDGSVWNISVFDRDWTNTWFVGDTILVGYSNDFFYPYYLTNQRNGTSVKAALSVVYPNYLTRRVIDVDLFFQQIWLDDGSKWDISPSDYGVTQRIFINDVVVIGVNNGKQSWNYPNILLDANMNEYVRSRCVYPY